MTDEEFQAEFEELRQKLVSLHEELEGLSGKLNDKLDKLDSEITEIHNCLDRIELRVA